jgi:hypothetical protein
MTKKKKSSRLLKALLETAEDMRRVVSRFPLRDVILPL